MSFTQEDLLRKVTLKSGDIAPEFSALNQDGVNIALKDFAGKNAVIIGISPDSVKSHESFINKQNLKHILLSDESHEICKAYGVWQVRKNYGKEYLGVARTTFIIDENGKIIKIYKSVKPAGHANKVLSEL